MKTLTDLFLDELADIYDAERRIVKALPKMARAATCNNLKGVIQAHLKESEGHVKKLERVFETMDKVAKGQTCEASVGLLEESEELTADFKGSPAINAALIAMLQKVEHYEIASYGCLHEWAGLMGNKEAASLLQQILSEEHQANEALTNRARLSSNKEAVGGSNGDQAATRTGRTPVVGRWPTPFTRIGPRRVQSSNRVRQAA